MPTTATDVWLTLKQRNQQYIEPYNHADAIEAVDNKALAKEYAQQSAILTPKTFCHCQTTQEFKQFLVSPIFLKGRFVLKPNHGSSGRGILISKYYDQTQKKLILAGGQVMSLIQVQQHAADVFSGTYSLGYEKDSLLIEEHIESHESFCGFSLNGLPDVRMVVYQGYPVMAMLRLATLFSEGKSNLSQGAIGVGLCLKTGKFKHAIQHYKSCHAHPDTGLLLRQIQVFAWDQLLNMAATCFDIYQLGYMGVDLTIADNDVPILLECNARPGLMIQQANQINLLPALRQVDALKAKATCALKRADYAKNHF